MRKKAGINVKIWGARGSYPTPGSDFSYYGGNTSCVETRFNNRLLIFDAGSGIIPLGRHIQEQQPEVKRILIFLSHTHHDHIIGLPFFKPLWMQNTRIDIFGPDLFDTNLSDIISTWFSSPLAAFFIEDVAAKITVHSINQWDKIILPSGAADVLIIRKKLEYARVGKEDAVLSIHKNFSHPKGGSFSYSLKYLGKKFSYVTDTENYVGGDKKVCDFIQGSDLLFHDCQFTDEDYPSHQGFGHSSLGYVLAHAKKSAVKKLVLFHLNPEYNDEKIRTMETDAKAIIPEAEAAREGNFYSL